MQGSFTLSEADRLASLRRYEVLDTPPEETFDRIVDLAARFFQVPISAVSLVDEDRQWFKARCGLDVSETSRDVSFCSHAIRSDELLIISDATADPRFADNPLVTGGPGIRFYAGAPLIMPDGHRLGSLCVIDRQPRSFGEADRRVLRHLAAMVVDELSLRAMLRQNLQWTTAIDNIGAGVILVDPRLPDLPITFANPGFLALTGYSREEVLGRNCRFMQGAGTDRAVVRSISDAVKAGRHFQGQVLNYHKDGTPFWNLVTISPVFDEAGTLVSYVGLQTDVTAQKRAEDAINTRARQAAAVAALGQQALAGAELPVLFDAAVQAVARTLDVELARLCEKMPGGGDLLIRAGVGWNPGIVGVHRLPGDSASLAGLTLRSGQTIDLENLRAQPGFEAGDPACAHGAVSGLCVVVPGRDGPFGTLGAMAKHSRRFDAEDLSFLQAVANVLATAVERQRGEKALSQSQARYHRITANVPGVVYQSLSDAEGRVREVRFVGDGSRDIFGLEPSFLQAHPHFLAEHVHPDDVAVMVRTRDEAARTLHPWYWQGRMVLPDQVERWIQAVARPERQPGGDILWDGLLMDVTEQRRAETLAQQKADADRANLAKSEFLSRMSHELRTPLNAILGFGQLMEIGTPAADENHESIRHILGAGRHLLKMVDEVLDIARIESGHLAMSLEPVSVAALLADTVNIVRPLAAQNGVHVLPAMDIGADLHVIADNQRLKQVLINLFSNAVKYNEKGGYVIVQCVPVPPGRLRIRVLDGGPTIGAELRARLFTPFDRLGAERSTVPGCGLGLALSKRLIEAMGGAIGFEPGGTDGPAAVKKHFWIELPLADGPGTVSASEGASGGNAWPPQERLPAGRTLLYIEDNLSNLRLIERLMERFPQVRLLTAMQGSTGLDLARQHRPDLILLDVHLPDLPGDEVLAQLRSDQTTCAIPVVIISADATERQIERMTAAGAAAYLTKPIDVHEFLRLVRLSMTGDPARN